MTRWFVWPSFAAAAAIALIAPALLYYHGYCDATVAAWGTWAGTCAVLIVGMVAIPQLALNKASVESDIFLKACAIIDEEEKFGKHLQMVLDNAVLLKDATLSDDGALVGIVTTNKPGLANAVNDVLYTMEQVGILFHYTTNRAMIEEYAGDTIIRAYDALSNIILDCQNEDKHMYERFSAMYEYCKPHWSRRAIAISTYTNVS
jgi:hypothetical protein